MGDLAWRHCSIHTYDVLHMIYASNCQAILIAPHFCSAQQQQQSTTDSGMRWVLGRVVLLAIARVSDIAWSRLLARVSPRSTMAGC